VFGVVGVVFDVVVVVDVKIPLPVSPFPPSPPRRPPRTTVCCVEAVLGKEFVGNGGGLSPEEGEEGNS